jgi:hypothetical protein
MPPSPYKADRRMLTGDTVNSVSTIDGITSWMWPTSPTT